MHTLSNTLRERQPRAQDTLCNFEGDGYAPGNSAFEPSGATPRSRLILLAAIAAESIGWQPLGAPEPRAAAGVVEVVEVMSGAGNCLQPIADIHFDKHRFKKADISSSHL